MGAHIQGNGAGLTYSLTQDLIIVWYLYMGLFRRQELLYSII